MDPWLLLGATAATAVWCAVSPYRRLLIKECIVHPRDTSIIERDPVTGKWHSYVVKPDTDEHSSGDVEHQQRR
jgi:hypothetical protein